MQNVEAWETYDPGRKVKGALPFLLTLLYLFLEYGRPQAFLPIDHLHLPAVAAVILTIALVFSGKAVFAGKQTKLFIALLLLMALFVPIAANNYAALETFKTMLTTFIIYSAIITFVDSYRKFASLIAIWLLIHAFLSVVGIFKGGTGIGGFLFDENDFCLTLNMVVPFAFFSFQSERKPAKKIAYILLSALFLFAIVATFSRGGFLGLAAVIGYCLMKSPRKILFIILIVLLSVVVVLYAPEKYWDRIMTIQRGAENPTGAGRIYLWRIGWEMFLDNPVFGVGQGNYPFRVVDYEALAGFGGGWDETSRGGRVAHSLYFTLLSELGLTGFLLFFLMLHATYRDALFIRGSPYTGDSAVLSEEEAKRTLYLGYALEAALVGYLVSGIFISVLYYPNFWILMGFTIALKRIVARSRGIPGLQRETPVGRCEE